MSLSRAHRAGFRSPPPVHSPEGATSKPARVEKTAEQIQKDIQDIMRQITSSVTFLPALMDKCRSSRTSE